jgi:hypothetical protein
VNGIAELFAAGPPLDEEQQVGRRPFIDGLDDQMGRGEKTKLLATRRTGKSSAARAVVQSALETLVQAGGPLEYVGIRLTLPQIDPGDWTSELKRRFKELGAPIDPDALHLLL